MTTVTVKRKNDLVVPASVRRRAGIKVGDKLEFRASRGMITIVTRPPDDSPMHLEAIEREIAKGLRDAKNGRIYGPFSAEEATRFIRRELKARAKMNKPKR